MGPDRASISEQFFQLGARGLLPGVFDLFGHPITADEFEILAEIAHLFFEHGFGAPLAALLGYARIVGGAIEAYAEVRPAFHAHFAAARITVQGPRFPAFMTMTIHGGSLASPRSFGEQNLGRAK